MAPPERGASTIMTCMIVLLLDPRWPTMIPFTLLSELRGRVEFSDEVPVQVRWNLGDVIGDSGNHAPRILVSTDEWDEKVRSAIADGARVVEVPSRSEGIAQAVDVMRRALRLGEWEQSQTHASLIAYLREEVEEFDEAVRGGDEQEMRDELGDLLLQVLFHAEIASQRGSFDFDAVAMSFVEKMAKRSPYLFDGTHQVVAIEEQERLWELGKQAQ